MYQFRELTLFSLQVTNVNAVLTNIGLQVEPVPTTIQQRSDLVIFKIIQIYICQ